MYNIQLFTFLFCLFMVNFFKAKTLIKEIPQPKEESYEDEGFEDYNDEDFGEAEENPSNIAPAKQPITAAPLADKRDSNSNQLSYIEAKRWRNRILRMLCILHYRLVCNRLKDEAKRQQGGVGTVVVPASVPSLGVLPGGSGAGKLSSSSHGEASTTSAASGSTTARTKKMVSMLPDPRFFRVQKIRGERTIVFGIWNSTITRTGVNVVDGP